jgi:hypothetical protein
MKFALWSVFGFLVRLWTGLIGLAEQLTAWLLNSTASGQIGDLASQALQWPVPAWLSPWVDTAWIKAVQDSALGLVQWLGQMLPSGSGLMGWVSVLMWAIWALGLAFLLALAVAGHWLLQRRIRQTLHHGQF